MATFPDIPVSDGTTCDTQFAVLEARFGDGYSQRTKDGINNRRETWNCVWENISDADVATIQAFLDNLEGVDYFDWTPPKQAVSKKWTCKQYGLKPGAAITTYTAKFTQEFDP